MEISASAREVLTSALPAHVATLDPDGTPHVSIAWVGIEDDSVRGHKIEYVIARALFARSNPLDNRRLLRPMGLAMT